MVERVLVWWVWRWERRVERDVVRVEGRVVRWRWVVVEVRSLRRVDRGGCEGGLRRKGLVGVPGAPVRFESCGVGVGARRAASVRSVFSM